MAILTRIPLLTRRAWQFATGETSIVTLTFIGQNLIRILSTVILTRILAPEAFGAIGVITSIAYVVAMVSDLGFQAFVVRHPDADNPFFRDVIWTIRLIRSIVLTIVLLVIAAPLAQLIGKPELTPLIQVFSVYFVMEGLVSMSLTLALRERKLLALGIVDLVLALVQLVFSVVLALYLRSYWAILIAMVISNCVRIGLSYTMFSAASVHIRFDRAYAGELFKFARFVTGSSIITLLLSQTDKLVLSRLFSLESFGLYVIAANLAAVPAGFVASYTSRLLYPRFADMWRDNPAALPSYFYASKRLLTIAYMLGVGALIGLAPLVIELLYDNRYRGASAYLSLLAIAPLLAFSNHAISVLLTATGKPQMMLNANMFRLIWLVALGPVGYHFYGPLGLIAAFATIEFPALLYHWYAMQQARMLSVSGELLPLGLGLLGIAAGYAGTLLLLPFL